MVVEYCTAVLELKNILHQNGIGGKIYRRKYGAIYLKQTVNLVL